MKPICVKCHRFYRPLKNGVYFREGMPVGGAHVEPGLAQNDLWTDYKLWSGDLWHCLGCGNQIIVGVGAQPLAVQHESDYPEWVARTKAQFRVNDC